MADASVSGGLRHSPIDVNQTLPGLSPQEEQAARLALSRLGSGSAATLRAATGSDSVMVGSGRATLLAGERHPALLSGSDSVVAGSAVALHAPATVPGGHGSGFHLSTDTIAQHGPTAAALKSESAHHNRAAGVTMPDHTKINVAGVSAHVLKHHSGHK